MDEEEQKQINEQLNEQVNEQLSEQVKLAQQIRLLERVAKQKMAKEAIARYGNLKLAHPEIAIRAITIIAQAIQLGQIKETIDDTQFKELLKQVQQDKRHFRIKK